MAGSGGPESSAKEVLMSSGEPRRRIGAAPSAFMGLQAHAAEFDTESHQAVRRGLALGTMLLILIAAPLVWSSGAFADDGMKAVMTSHGSGSSGPGGGDDDGDGDGDGDDGNSGPGGSDDDSGATATSGAGTTTAGTNTDGATNDTTGDPTGTATSNGGSKTAGTNTDDATNDTSTASRSR
jgi:hypothetical protein